jgi:hypothetical protein
MEETFVRLLEAVKEDNAGLFSQLIDQKKALLSVSFGRFPLLSLCYLYRSTKILRGYEKILSQITQFSPAEEDFLSYKKFRSYAGKCMRLYRKGRFIYPLEMLAVLNETYYLNKVYPYFNKPAGTAEHLEKIYAVLRGKHIKADEKSILLPRNPLRPRQKLLVAVALMLSAILIFVSAYAMDNIRFLTGEGTEKNPYRIAGEVQLIRALEDSFSYCVLTKDITLTQKWTAVDFKGTLDGGGHTIYAEGHTSEGFFKTMSGTIKNTSFDFFVSENVAVPLLAAQNIGTMTGLDVNVKGEGTTEIATALLLIQNAGTLSDISLDIQCDADIHSNSSLFLYQNQGTLSGVTARVLGNFREESAAEVLYFSSLVYQNTGILSDSTLYCEATYMGNADGDAYFAGFAAINSGKIERCETSEGSFIRTDTVDIAGIITTNEATGTLSACINRAEIAQTTSSDQWSPNAAGIVTSNSGAVTDCVNAGVLRAEQKAPSGNKNLIAFAAGICAENIGILSDCQNTGNVFVLAEHYEIYAGGISGINRATLAKSKNSADVYGYSGDRNAYVGGIAGYNTSNSRITGSGSFGLISLEYNSEVQNGYLFAGGIAGGNYGGIHSCFACCTFAYTLNGAGTLRVGGISGLNYGEYSYFTNSVYLDSEDNYYLMQPNLSFGIASIYYQKFTQSIFDEGNNVGATAAETLEEIKSTEVYWE